MKMKSVALKCIMLPLAACTVSHASSESIVINKAQFADFLRNGIITEKKLSIDNNIQFKIDLESFSLKEGNIEWFQVLQPVTIKNGMLFMINYADKIDSVANKLVSTGGVSNIIGSTMEGFYQQAIIKNEILDYPRFPIIFRSYEAEKLSLMHLIYVFYIVSPEFKNFATALDLSSNGKTNSEKNLKTVLQNWIKVPERIPDDFNKLITSLNAMELDTSHRNFKYAEERLFTTMNILEKDIGNFRCDEFLKKIFEIDKKLTATFNTIAAKDEDYKNKLRIIKYVLQQNKNIEKRNLLAKALILDIFTRIDDAPVSILEKIQEQDSVFLCKSYGQMARFIAHVTDKEHRHVFRENEAVPFGYHKSYFLLKGNDTYLDFYDKLYDAVIQGDEAFAIHDVAIKQTNQGMNDWITIDIRISEEAQQKILSCMYQCTELGNRRKTDLLRFVIRDNDGFFDMITAYPIYKNEYTVITHEKQQDMLKLYKDYFFPEHVKQMMKSHQVTKILIHK